jgi:hypothetical protein
VTLRRLSFCEERRCFEQILERVDADDAVRAKERVRHFVGARHRAGVRRGEILSDFGAPHLVDHDLLASRVSAACGKRKLVGVAQRLHEEEDRLGVRIVDQEVREFADTQVRFVAD